MLKTCKMDRTKLLEKLKGMIKPSKYFGLLYYPCGVELKEGKMTDCVCFVDKKIFYEVWGDAPKGRLFIDISDVKDIFESKYCLSRELAQKIYDARETGMGYYRFIAIMKDGERFTYTTGGLVDFLEPPEGYSIKDIIDVIPHKGDRKNYYKEKDYYWCLVDDLQDGRSW